MLQQQSPPWWAGAARWAFTAILSKIGLQPSSLLSPTTPHIPARSMSPFWLHVLTSWRMTGGSLKVGIGNCSLEAILGLPLDHPDITIPRATNKPALTALRKANLYTLGDIFERNPATGAAITRADDAVLPFIMLFRQGRIYIQPPIIQRLLNYPATPNRDAVWASVKLGDAPLERYTPRDGRHYAAKETECAIKWNKWMPEGRNNTSPSNQLEKPRWATLPRINLEPKYTSLIWLMAHAAVPTAVHLSHMVPGLSRCCRLCPNTDETISHYFWSCPRTQRYWLLVSPFLHSIQTDQTGDVFSVQLESVVNGFGKQSRKIPNADTLHALAVWESYQSHAELSIDNIRHTGDAMFMRWKAAVVFRILHDFQYFCAQLKSVDGFRTRWLQVSNRWFHFDPGGDELNGSIIFRDTYALDRRLQYFIPPDDRPSDTTGHRPAATTTLTLPEEEP